MSPVLNHVCGGTSIRIILVCLFVSTKLFIQLIPSFVSFFPTSFEPPHTTTASCFDSCCISLFAEVIIVLNPLPGFTNPWTLKFSYSFDFISVAHPRAWLSPVTMILRFFSFCLFSSAYSLYLHFSSPARVSSLVHVPFVHLFYCY